MTGKRDQDTDSPGLADLVERLDELAELDLLEPRYVAGIAQDDPSQLRAFSRHLEEDLHQQALALADRQAEVASAQAAAAELEAQKASIASRLVSLKSDMDTLIAGGAAHRRREVEIATLEKEEVKTAQALRKSRATLAAAASNVEAAAELTGRTEERLPVVLAARRLAVIKSLDAGHELAEADPDDDSPPDPSAAP